MKRSRTRRIFSLFMVLTGILLVFSGFLQDARMPASVAQEPAGAKEWPDCGWKDCPAGDLTVGRVWLGDEDGVELFPCNLGDPVTGYIWAEFLPTAASDRYCVILMADVFIDGDQHPSIDKCVLDTVLGGEPARANLYPVDWTCGDEVVLANVLLVWRTVADKTCDDVLRDCNQFPSSKCFKEAQIIVEPPPILALSIDKTGDIDTATCGDAINYTITVTNSGDDTLHNVTVVDTKLGINENVGTLAAGESDEIEKTYSVTESDLPGPIKNVASATSTETLVPVVAEWTVTLTDDGPVLTCPPQINEQCPDDVPDAYGNLGAFEDAGGSATDKCGIDEASFRLVSEVSDGKTCPETITRIYEIADTSGNKDQCTQLIVVDDTIPPVITCPLDVEVCTVPGETTASSVVLGTATATDNCDPHPVVTNNALTTFPAGDTTVTWTATDACGNSATCTQKVTVKVSPVASFDTGRGVGPLDVQFTDTSSGNIAEWSWKFGDTGTSIEQNPSHTYAEGTYTVILTVTDANGCTDYTEKVIAVSAKMLITITATDECDGNEVCFEGWADLAPQRRVSLSALEGYTFLWDFGDPDTSDDWSDEDDPCYMYTGPGTYDVTLTVTHDDTEVSATAPKQVTVWANPTASFTAVPDSGVAPLTVQFNDGSSRGSPNGGAIIDWDWDFGDPASGVDDSSTLKDPTHEYASAGTYTVVLIVTDEHGCTDNDTTTVTVTPRPELSIEKKADKFTANIDDVINYTITVENTGDLTLTKVRVQDAKLGIDETIDSLAPGATAEVSGTYGPVTEDDLPGPIHNVATAASNETPDPVEASWDVTLITGPAIQVVKTANKDEFMVGEIVKYTIKVENIGNVTLTNVRVQDSKLKIDKLIGSLAPGETAQVSGSYGPLEDSDVGDLVNTASAWSDETDPVEDSCTVTVVKPEAEPALLAIQKTGDAGPLSVGDTIEYTIKVTNSGDATLTNVVVNDAKLGIIDLNIGDLDPGETYEITASYGPLEVSDVGFVDNTASAESDQTEPVEDSWRVQVVEPGAEPEPTPTPIPCIRSDIDVIVYGKIPVEVDMYIAGDLDHSKQTAVNAFGEQQATFSVWPGAGETYVVSITPRVPGYLAPDEWTFQLIEGSLTMRIPRCVHREVILQLLHSGPSVTPAPTLPVEELPVTGVPLPASSFGGRLLKLLGFLLIGSGGLFYWTSRRD